MAVGLAALTALPAVTLLWMTDGQPAPHPEAARRPVRAPAVLAAQALPPAPHDTDAVVLNVATRPYLPRPDEVPAETPGAPDERLRPRRLAAPTQATPGGRPAPFGAESAQTQRPAEPAEPAPLAAFVPRLAEGINAYRERHGLQPWVVDPTLELLAEAHSQAMAHAGRLSHEGFRERLLATGSRMCVENVAHNFRTVDGVLQGWRASPGHDRNLLEAGVQRMGLADHARYTTMIACR